MYCVVNGQQSVDSTSFQRYFAFFYEHELPTLAVAIHRNLRLFKNSHKCTEST